MPRMRALSLFAILVVLVPTSSAAERHYADLVLRGGAVYTLTPAKPWAEAVAVSGGRIVFVGGDREASAFVGPRTRVVDLDGKMVLPGFHDTHVHPIDGGLEASQCTLYDFSSPDQVAEAVRAYAAAHPNDAWIRGSGWQLPVFPDANPPKALLDRAVGDRPALLWAADGHSAWVSSKALALAGVTHATPDPPNGRIERDPATGEPSGTLREAATDLVAKLLPATTSAERLDGLRRALRIANAAGITALYEANARPEEVAAYAELERRGELTARVRAALRVDPSKGVEQVAALDEERRRSTGALFRPDAAKIFADGVIEAKTSYLVEPYVGTSDRGPRTFTPEALDALVAELDRRGFQVHVHAIGDGAVREALDAFERARRANGARDARHVIAHLELVDPSDVPRFRRLGVVADFQPLWAYRDTYITKLTEPVLGPERSSRLYPIGSLVRSGAAWAFGSDWPVTSIAPLDAIQVAVTRRGLDAGPGEAWLPEERIALPDAIAGYTSRAAFVDFWDETGTIEVGKQADLVVLGENLFDVPPERIHGVKVVTTLLGGKEVFRAS
jgi:predicted amidohydrolase YtcJ